MPIKSATVRAVEPATKYFICHLQKTMSLGAEVNVTNFLCYRFYHFITWDKKTNFLRLRNAGITRGKKLVILVGDRKSLWVAVKNHTTNQRLSSLKLRNRLLKNGQRLSDNGRWL